MPASRSIRRTISRAIGAGLLLATLAGCADTPLAEAPLALRDEALPHLGNTHLYLMVTQPQLDAGAATTMGLSKARLLSLLYGPLHQETAAPATAGDDASSLTPLREAVADYDFDAQLQTQLQQQLQNVAWLKLQDAQLLKKASDIDTLPLQQNGSALWLVASYSLSADFSTLTISSQCALTPPAQAAHASTGKAAELQQQFDDAAYRNNLAYAVRLAKPGSRDDNAAQWQARQGAALRSALTRGITLISATLVQDLQNQIPRSSADKQLVDGEYVPRVGNSGSAVLFRFEGGLKYFDTLDPAAAAASRSAAPRSPSFSRASSGAASS